MARNHRTGLLHYSPAKGGWADCWADKGNCPYGAHGDRMDYRSLKQKTMTKAFADGGGALPSGFVAQDIGQGLFRIGKPDSQRFTYYNAEGKRLTENDARRARALAKKAVPIDHDMVGPQIRLNGKSDKQDATQVTTSGSTWHDRPWTLRKLDIELYAIEELAKAGIKGVDIKWSRATTRWGAAMTRSSVDWRTGERYVMARTLSMSDKCRDLDEATVKGVVLHEVAHFVAGHEAGHGHEWKAACAAIDDGRGVVLDNHSYAMSEAEFQRAKERMELERKELRTSSPWLGTCPQGHEFPAKRKPRSTYVCANSQCESLPSDQRRIVYSRRG